MNKEQQEGDSVLTILRDLHTIRNRTQAILNLAKHNKLAHFALAEENMTATASFVTEVIRQQYPDLNLSLIHI